MRDLSNRSTGRQQFGAAMRLVQKAQHAVPGVVLLKDGLVAIRDGVAGWRFGLAIAEVVTAAAVAVTLFMALRKLAADVKAKRAPHMHFGIDWIDIFLGFMLFTEVAATYHVTHKWWRPATLMGMALIFVGIYGGRIAHRKIERRRARKEREAQGAASR
jgi:hypothetical protein